MSRGAWRYAALEHNTREVMEFCKKYKFHVKSLNNGYQLRIEEVMDVYPVRQRWHFLPDGDRGGWHDMNDLKKILLDKLAAPFPRLTEPAPIGPIRVNVWKPPKKWWQIWRRK